MDPRVQPPAGTNWGDLVAGTIYNSRSNRVHIARLVEPTYRDDGRQLTAIKLPGLCTEYVSPRTGELIKTGTHCDRLATAGNTEYGFSVTDVVAGDDGTMWWQPNPEYRGRPICRFCWKQYEAMNAPEVTDEQVTALVSTGASGDKVVAAAQGLKPSQIAAARRLMINRISQLKNSIQSKYNEYVESGRREIEARYKDQSKVEGAIQATAAMRERFGQEWRQFVAELAEQGVRPGSKSGYRSSFEIVIPSEFEFVGKEDELKQLSRDADAARGAALLALERSQLDFEEKLLIAQLHGTAASDLLSAIPNADELFEQAVSNEKTNAEVKELTTPTS